KREPGRGVHAGAAFDVAAGSVHGSPRPPDHPALDEGRRRMTQSGMTQAGTAQSGIARGVTRTDVVLTADPARVLARLFVPGHELSHDGRSLASGVLARILALPEDDVGSTVKR